MKVNEIVINEGFWDTVKAVGAGIAGMPSGKGAANFRTGMAKGNINDWANDILKRWQTEIAPSIPANSTDNQIKGHLDRYLEKYLGGKYTKGKLVGANDPNNVLQYILNAANLERLGTPVQARAKKATAPAAEPVAPAAEPAPAPAAEPAATTGKRELPDIEYTPATPAAIPAAIPATFKHGDPIVVGKGQKPLKPGDPSYETIANQMLAQNTASTSTKPKLEIPAGANPREVKEYKKRYQQQLNTWNKYNNPDYAEPEVVAAPAASVPPPVPAAAPAPSYNTGWKANAPTVKTNTRNPAPMPTFAPAPAPSAYNPARQKTREPATAESAGGVPWSVRKPKK
jgi:hypothetical protein